MVRETFPELGALGRRVIGALLARTAEGWHLWVKGDGTAILVGPGGVFAILAAEERPDDRAVQALLRHVEERCAGLRGPRGQVLASSAIGCVVVTPGGGASGVRGRPYWLLAEQDLARLFERDANSLDRRHVNAIADQLGARLPDYRRLKVASPERGSESEGLVETRDLTADQLAAAQLRPFETWMTFLHPQQHAIVMRNYGGPARISGPAGTGKTVVALHRLRYLARRSVGPLLFTTFVRTLPLVHEKSFQRLAPELAERVEFINLHAWVRGFLGSRGREVTVQPKLVDNAFGRAWLAHRGPLQDLEPSPPYWQAEIDRVIKGRGVRTLPEYVATVRKGRGLGLTAGQKAHVWRLYEAYQDNLATRQLLDYNDLITEALAELAARPLAEPYAAVVVDEVQDITLTGLRLLRELAGDGPNRLLLVGDGQQQVYPGGWRLSDAGIPVQGRGAVLRVNYRNRAEVLGFARRFDAMNYVDDLDGELGVALREAEVANAGGEVGHWQGSEQELPDALAAAIEALPVPRGQTALIVFQHRDLERCTAILQKAGIPVLPLEHYQGETDDRLKVGTVHRAKGLDFQAVLAIQFAHNTGGGAVEQELRQLRERQHLVAATRARDFLWWAVVG